MKNKARGQSEAPSWSLQYVSKKTGIKAVILKGVSMLKWEVLAPGEMAGSRLAWEAKTHHCARRGWRPLTVVRDGWGSPPKE